MVSLGTGVVFAQPQESGPLSWDGVAVGMQGGAFGGTPAGFHGYSLVDGSGSHFAGFDLTYDRHVRPHLTIGATTDVSFVAEPPFSAGETPELFGTVRGRVGYATRQWRPYGTGGFAWTRNRRADSSEFAHRLGWSAGAGLERALAPRWTLDAEYLYSRFGGADASAGPLSATMSMPQFRLGVNYRVSPGSEAAPPLLSALDISGWAVHGQMTYLTQYAAPFRAPYRAANSLDANSGRETWDVTLYVGHELWTGGAVWVNPEIDQGYGLSNTLGVAGFPSGEAYKVGYTHPYVRVPRAFVQQVFNLGGEIQTVEGAVNQLATTRSANRVVLTAGKFSVSDLFDTVTYAHDPRNDFMNWALVDAGTFDYAADAWGFTYGAALEWYYGVWTARAALFDLSAVPNSVDLDSHVGQYQTVYEIEHRHAIGTHPGKLSFDGFLTRGRMGRFDDAIALAQATREPADIAAVRRYTTRPGVNVNVEQQLSSYTAVFGRVGVADGTLEPYEFADIDRTASGGISLSGTRWGRPTDIFAIAALVNDISSAHRAYLNAGGLGILVGDGQLPHPGAERIVETYYRVPLCRLWQLTGDYQFVVNPAYNRDRGPVSVFAARLHWQF